MALFRRTLYTRIAGLYLLLILAFCLVVAVFTAHQFDAFLEELEQRLNRDVATHLAAELAPDLATGLSSSRTKAAVRRVRAINPALDVYVLNAAGGIVGAYTETQPPAGARVDLAPVRRFLADGATLPIRANDPSDAERGKVFSAAPLALPGAPSGYLFVILRGTLLETAASMLLDSYIVRGVALGLSLMLLSVLIVGLVSFSLLTRRFRRLTETVQRFSDGDHRRRVSIDSDDEIGRLGKAFNEMAGMIEAQIEALRRTDEERRALVANVSHDFRTPLTSLRGYAQRLAERWEGLDSASRQECLDTISSNTEHLERLAGQLLSLSLLDASTQTVQIEPFALGELVQDVVLKFRPRARERGVLLNAHYPVQPAVCGDVGLIDRVLCNLIDNAVRNTAEGGRVAIDMELVDLGRDGAAVRVLVSDTGCGIAAEELPLVTRRFYRTERGRASASSGSGLGLAIAREILELHGSTLELQSALGAGSTISFTLPAEPCGSEGRTAASN